jgi:hypothetical protein
MSEKNNRSERIQQARGAAKLKADLAGLDVHPGRVLAADMEMLSLIIDEVSKGVDIQTRYPTFYRKLLANAELRQAFLDALEILESEPAPVNLPAADLSFLKETPRREMPGAGRRVTWSQTLAYLQSLFSPSELVYRSDADLFEDAWHTLLRGEGQLDETVYTVQLDAALAEEPDDALSVVLTIAISLAMAQTETPMPLHASLQWGSYAESIRIDAEGRTRFPNVPLSAVFDDEYKRIQSGLSLTIETP